MRRAVLVYAVLSALFAAWLVVGSLEVPSAAARTDWMSYQAAARQVLDGHGDCLYDRDCQIAAQRDLVGSSVGLTRGLPYNNPPSLAVLAMPMAALPLGVALAIWIVIGTLAFVIAAWKLLDGSRQPRLVPTLLALSSWPIVSAALHGQVSLPIAALLAGSVALVLAGPPGGAGGLVGAATLKPTLVPLIVLWFAITRRWGDLMTIVSVAVLMLAIAAIFVGPGQVLAYPSYALGQLGDSNAAGIDVEQMVNWRAAGVWVGSGAAGVTLVVAGSLTTTVAAIFVWLRGNPALGIATALVATPLLVPHANQHEAALAVVAWLVLLKAYPHERRLAAIGLAMQVALWSAVVTSASVAGQLLFAFLLISLATVVILAEREHRYGVQLHEGGSTSASGQRGTAGGRGAAEG